MEQPVKNLRGFFSSFFKCKQPVWSGFLAGWPGLPGNEYHENWSSRLSFALEMFVNMPNDVRFAMVFYSIQYTIRYGPNTLLRSLTPSFFFGAGPADRLYEDLPETLGDVEAKLEARTMMKEFRPTAKVTYNKKTTEEEVVRDESTLVLFPAPFNS
jgi:lycopene beta-cyclase